MSQEKNSLRDNLEDLLSVVEDGLDSFSLDSSGDPEHEKETCIIQLTLLHGYLQDLDNVSKMADYLNGSSEGIIQREDQLRSDVKVYRLMSKARLKFLRENY